MSFDDINNNFSVGPFVSLAVECVFWENQIFQNLYFNDFFKWSEPSNTYHYQIDIGPYDSKTLILTNSDDNQAIYGDEALDVQEFYGKHLIIYPNPVKNNLIIKSSKSNTGNLAIKIFNIEGKLLSTQNSEFEKQVSIDVSSLSIGIYFLNIEDENGKTHVKTFLKE